MNRQHPQDPFDRQARAHYQLAASSLSPAMQGRLRAARRTALLARHGERESGRRPAWFGFSVATAAAAIIAVSIGLRWQHDAGTDSTPATAAGTALAVAARTGIDPVDSPADRDRTQAHVPVAADTAIPRVDVSEPAVVDTTLPDAVAATSVAVERVAMQPQAGDAPDPSSETDPALLAIEEDPDFYLWLDGEDQAPASPEAPHDAT